jgi:hypothetical protein
MTRRALALAALVLLAPCSAAAQADPNASGAERRDVWLGAELHGSFFGDLQDRSTVLPRFGYGVRAGRRWGRYGVFGLVDRDHWIVSELDVDYTTGVLNLALGAELLFASRSGQRVRRRSGSPSSCRIRCSTIGAPPACTSPSGPPACATRCGAAPPCSSTC